MRLRCRCSRCIVRRPTQCNVDVDSLRVGGGAAGGDATASIVIGVLALLLCIALAVRHAERERMKTRMIETYFILVLFDVYLDALCVLR